MSLQSPGADDTSGAVSGVWPCRVLCVQESSGDLQEVGNYSALKQKASEQERTADSIN